MSAPFGPFALTLDDITKQIRDTFETFIDPRKGKNTRYTMVDAALSAFSVFFMQSPSFLEYQRSLEQTHGENNARTLFGVHDIPSDNPIRTLLDATPPSAVNPVYSFLFNALNQAPAWWMATARRTARCCSPWMGQSIFRRLSSIAMAVQRGSMPTAK